MGCLGFLVKVWKTVQNVAFVLLLSILGQIYRPWGHADHISPRLMGWKLGCVI